ncbi:hypothetical protein [Neorhizobium sp. NCHU2750]|uniref:hypothetical protein n=1 Tax=Neorhizobium sp. NCHU2750 TaxID=1825976 RepID=UPI0013C43CDE
MYLSWGASLSRAAEDRNQKGTSKGAFDHPWMFGPGIEAKIRAIFSGLDAMSQDFPRVHASI